MNEKNESSAESHDKAEANLNAESERERLEREAVSALKRRLSIQRERIERAFACLEKDDLAGLQEELSDWPEWETEAKRREAGDEVFSLLMAAIPERPRCADWLIGQVASAEPPRPQDQDQKPLMRALLVEADSPQAAQAVEWFARLIPKSRLGESNHNGRTAMTRAAAQKNPGFVQALLDAGVNPDGKDAGGYWAVLAASVNGATQTLLALIQGGASLSVLDESGRDALMRVASQGTTKSVAVLAAHCDLSHVCEASASRVKGARGSISALEIALHSVRTDPRVGAKSRRWAAVDAIGARLEAQGTASRRQKETLRSAWAMGGAECLPMMAAAREAKMLAKMLGLSAKKKAKPVEGTDTGVAVDESSPPAFAERRGADAPPIRANTRRM